MGIEQYHFIISGRVQGVGYRYSSCHYAQSLALLGWVKNCSDGKVEMIAEGDNISLEQLLTWLKKGPRFAKVNKVEVQQLPATGEFTEFSIR
ncbi:MAG: acylphosphatase [Methylophaga sp.]|nr:MAG: acylphosphatase [Methylophaga sp.]